MKLLTYLKKEYSIGDHLDHDEDRSFTNLYIETKDFYADILTEYTQEYNPVKKSVSVHNISFYIEGSCERVPISEEDRERIENEFNKQINS